MVHWKRQVPEKAQLVSASWPEFPPARFLVQHDGGAQVGLLRLWLTSFLLPFQELLVGGYIL